MSQANENNANAAVAAVAAAVPTNDDSLPEPLTLSSLLSQVSFEHRNGTLGLIVTDEQKRHIQQIIKTQTTNETSANTTATGAPSSSSSSSSSSSNTLLPPSLFSTAASPSLSFAGLPPFPTASSESSTDPASELAPTPLFRALSDAAALGLISHAVKSEIKGMLLNNRINCLSTNRMVRQVSAAGEVSMVEVKIDLSKIDEDECARLQEEEREALEAIYAEDVKFAVTSHQLDENAEEEIKADEEGEEAQEEEEEEKDGSSSSEADAEGEDADPNSRACITVNVLIKPYPASGPDRNLVSTRVRFTLPPLYPFVRPSFHIVSVEGKMDESEGMMMGTVMNEKLNELFQVEPVPADEARVVLFDLIQAAEAFLQEYMDFLDDKAYQAQLQEEKEEAELILKQRLKAELDAQAAKEAEIKHAQAAYAYLTSDHKKLEFSSTGTLLSTNSPEYIMRQEAERQKREAARIASEEADKKAMRDAEEALKRMSHSDSLIVPTHQEVVASIRTVDRNFPHFYFESFAKGDLFFESIISPFLRYRFIKARAAMRAAGRIDTISIGYHGTMPNAVESIRTKGLVVPGERLADGTSIGHRCDVGYFGRGIYLSPNLSYSLGYGSWNNMFVCLVLRGSSYCAEYSLGRGLEAGFDSHHDPSQNEWIIFNSACVLPVYLIKGSAAYAPAPYYEPPPPPPPASAKVKAAKYSSKPPASSKSAKILLAKIQKEKIDKPSKQGPVSSVPKKKK